MSLKDRYYPKTTSPKAGQRAVGYRIPVSPCLTSCHVALHHVHVAAFAFMHSTSFSMILLCMHTDSRGGFDPANEICKSQSQI